MTADDRLASPLFPRAAQYHHDWIVGSVSGGAHVLWLTEWLTSALDLRPGMRVLDLACGRAASSVFLRREFGVEVWAVDLWCSAAENAERVRDAGVADGVFPLNANARALPFAPDFFDAIICIDAYFYFGTDDLYLNYLARFLKPGGVIAIAGAGLMREFDDTVPDHLRAWWSQDCWCLHSAGWWSRHWARTGLVDVEIADTMADGWQRWLDWHRVIAPGNVAEIVALEADRGECLGYVRVVAHRNGDVAPGEHVESVPSHYVRHPLLRDDT